MTRPTSTDCEPRVTDPEPDAACPDGIAGGLAHDLRNPLTVARGALSLAAEGDESEHLVAVARALDRIDAIVEVYAAVARDGSMVVDERPVDLASIVGRCWQGVPTSGGTLVVDAERTVVADPKRLLLLLENVVRNAVEHGGDDVTVTVGDLPDGFSVEDDGDGIPEGERDRVFEAGYSTSASGSGIGLAIVAAVADAHGWDIRVTEGTEGGVRFEVTGVETAG